LEAGQLVRDRAHVPTALHVVLPAQRLQPRTNAADAADKQRQVDQRKHVVDSVVVLGDPERPAHLGVLRVAPRMRELTDRVGGHTGHALCFFERPRLDGLAVRVVTGRRTRDELLVDQPGGDPLARDGVCERDVGADVEPEPQVGPLCRRGAARVDDEQLRATVHGLQQVVEEDRVRIARVRAPEDDQVRTLAQLLVGTRPATCTEHRRQTDDARGVSGAVTAVDVVGAESDPAELLSCEVQLVRGLGATEDPSQFSLMGSAAEAGGGSVERLVPGRGPQLSVVTNERLGQPRVPRRHAPILDRNRGALVPHYGTTSRAVRNSRIWFG